MEDPYKILGIEPDSNQREIRQAYRDGCKKYHPDSGLENGREDFLKIQNAYERLSNPEQGSIRINAAAGDTAFRARSAAESGRYNAQVFADSHYARTVPEEPVSMEIILSPTEARFGCVIPLSIPVPQVCRACSGSGWSGFGICRICRGRGFREINHRFRLVIPPNIRSGTMLRISPDTAGLAIEIELSVSR